MSLFIPKEKEAKFATKITFTYGNTPKTYTHKTINVSMEYWQKFKEEENQAF